MIRYFEATIDNHTTTLLLCDTCADSEVFAAGMASASATADRISDAPGEHCDCCDTH